MPVFRQIISFTSIFSLSATCLFIVLKVSLVRVFNSDEVFLILWFYFCVLFKKSLLIRRSRRYSPSFSSSIFIVLAGTFGCTLNLYKAWRHLYKPRSSVFYSCEYLFPPYTICWRVSFLQLWCLCQKSTDDVTAGPSPLFSWSVSPYAKTFKVLVLQSCLTLWFHGLYPSRLLCPWNSPGKNSGMGSHFLLQGICST